MDTLLFFLLVFQSAFSASKAWNISIDCGALSSYNDDTYSITWTGDASLIQSGESYQVQHNYRPLRTLRVFSSGKRNCYSVNATSGEQVLVRASFYYGNYDNKSDAPTFELQFDGNFWATVATEIDQAVTHEAIYFTKRDVISVCVAQTEHNHMPFMSSLEVRSLAPDMYPRASKNHALFTKNRLNFGPNLIRHPDDSYDRIWRSANTLLANGLVVSRKQPPSVNNITENPPATIFLDALVSAEAILGFIFPSLPKDEVPIIMNMYFAEVIAGVENRSFAVLKDNTFLFDEPIVPSYEQATKLTISNITASSQTVFSLVSTGDNVRFAPLINALEMFVVSDSLTDGTNNLDVEGLDALRRQFSVLEGWRGDPCLPENYSWDWVHCSNDISPRVIALNLDGYGLSGPLPDISSMDALQIIDLKNNNLNGTIPDFLGNLPNLKILNLANNNFTGSIPSTISGNSNLNFTVSGNTKLCTSNCKNSGGGMQRTNLPVTFAASVSTLIVSWFIF